LLQLPNPAFQRAFVPQTERFRADQRTTPAACNSIGEIKKQTTF
jgi:hypothetical protein